MKFFILLFFLLISSKVNAVESQNCSDWEKTIKKGLGMVSPSIAQDGMELVKSGFSDCLGDFFSKGAHYEGDRTNGKMNGTGILIFPDGSKYPGDFKDDSMSGHGTFIFPDGTKYIGQWIGGKQNGHGLYIYADGTQYEGDWSNGRYNGKGTITYANGEKYVGGFNNGSMTGQGIYMFPNGSNLEGLFYEGQYVLKICDKAGLPEGSEENKQCILMYMNKIIG